MINTIISANQRYQREFLFIFFPQISQMNAEDIV